MLLFLADYHTHSGWSPDGENTVPVMAAAACAAGLQEIAITDHCDMARASEFNAAGQRKSVMTMKDYYAGRVRVVYAIELGEATHAPEQAAAIVRDNPFDFILGSYHQLKHERDFYHLRYTDAGQCNSLISVYLDELLELCSLDCFDVLGHMTYPLRYMRSNPSLAGLSFQPFEEQTRAVFRALIDSGRGIELNVSGLYRGTRMTMPDLALLKQFRALGGEIVTVGSDAHSASDVGRGIREGQDILREAGFRYVAAYEERRPRFENLE